MSQICPEMLPVALTADTDILKKKKKADTDILKKKKKAKKVLCHRLIVYYLRGTDYLLWGHG